MYDIKYKIRVSYKTYVALVNDMYAFNFCKENGIPNKNKFYTSLIDGFYSNINKRKNKIFEHISNSLVTYIKDENTLIAIAEELYTKINEVFHSDINTHYHSFDIYINHNKNNSKMFEYIEQNELANETMSEFIRNIFNEYISLPSYEREKILYNNNYNDIVSAINNNLTLKIVNTRNATIILEPYIIVPSYEDTYNYLIGKNISSKNKTFFSIKLSRIKKVTLINKKSNFTYDEIKKINHQLEDGHEFLCDETIKSVIKLDSSGVKQFNACYKDRPLPINIDKNTGEYTFESDMNKLFLYFRQFGRHAKIISPDKLKNKINKFHKEAIDDIDY